MRSIVSCIFIFLIYFSPALKSENKLLQHENINYVKDGQKKLNYDSTLTFQNISVPYTICATYQNENHLRADSLIILFNNKKHLIKTPDLFFISPSAIKNTQNIIINDFNFDNYPDIGIYNSQMSGVNNLVYDIFLYNTENKKYVRHEQLSEIFNISVNKEQKTINSYYIEGMASQLYISSSYKWDRNKLILFYSVTQTYNNSLKLFIKETMFYENGIKQIKQDTIIQ